MFSPRLASLTLLLVLPALAPAVESETGGVARTGLKPPERLAEPQLHPASDEPLKAMKKFTVPNGFKVDLWAAEPMLGNPVAFTFDDKGNAFVAETYRYRSSVLDIRHYMFMLEDDLAVRTTDDRIASTKKNFPSDWQKLGIETEVVRRLEDSDGDGKADKSSAYASEMNTLLDGINSGVLAYNGKVWCTNMPNLWLFSGLTKDGKAEKRESLSFGYGVRFSFTGHDMHGLILGPDGRLYFSFGDRGASVKTKEGKTLAFPDEGAVFRCEPDGSHMEVFCRGLRNPQELAFDNHGNLFTGDNDSDQGDRERWEYLVQGGDYGWRVGWQHHPLGKENNPWIAEQMWELRKEGTPYYILSPVLLLPDGPSGVAHYPGTGLPAEYEDHFFVCGFKGSSARSAIATLRVKESGAGFASVVEPKTFLGEVQATDVEFGPDSRIYLSEWGEGWEGTGRGRIFRMEHTQAQQEQAAQIAEVKKLLADGFAQRSNEELGKLLAHKDQRVRLRAQWALAGKPEAELDKIHALLMSIAARGVEGPERFLSRLHALWALGNLNRLRLRAAHPDGDFELPVPAPDGLALLNSEEPEIRAQALVVLNDLPGRWPAELTKLVTAKLADPAPRVRFFAATALSNHPAPEATPAILAMLKESDNKDQFLRHAGTMALTASGDAAIAQAAKDEAVSVRVAALLAMRRLEKQEIAQFLADKDPLLVKEAARAINDAGITGAFEELGQLIDTRSKDAQLMLRAINANFRTGTPAAAQALAKFAADETAPEALRVEALKALGTWAKPAPRDRIAGIYRPLPERSATSAVMAVQAVLPQLLATKSGNVLASAIDTVASLAMKTSSPALFELIAGKTGSPKARGKALETLAAFDDSKLSEAVKLALTDKDAGLHITAMTILGKLAPDEAAQELAAAFANSKIPEKKTILTALGGLKSAGADKALVALLDDLRAGKVAPEVQLELVEGAAKRTAPEVKKKLEQYEANLPKGDLMAAFASTLAGGDPVAGEKLFKEHAVAQCFRCHKIGGSGGEAGPDMTGIGVKKDRKYLLESIIQPNAQIAEGFQSMLVTLKNGDMQMGIVKKETADELTLQMPAPGVPPVTVKVADVKSRENAPSGMPPGLDQLLTKREIRDILEYLATQR